MVTIEEAQQQIEEAKQAVESQREQIASRKEELESARKRVTQQQTIRSQDISGLSRRRRALRAISSYGEDIAEEEKALAGKTESIKSAEQQLGEAQERLTAAAQEKRDYEYAKKLISKGDKGYSIAMSDKPSVRKIYLDLRKGREDLVKATLREIDEKMGEVSAVTEAIVTKAITSQGRLLQSDIDKIQTQVYDIEKQPKPTISTTTIPAQKLDIPKPTQFEKAEEIPRLDTTRNAYSSIRDVYEPSKQIEKFNVIKDIGKITKVPIVVSPEKKIVLPQSARGTMMQGGQYPDMVTIPKQVVTPASIATGLQKTVYGGIEKVSEKVSKGTTQTFKLFGLPTEYEFEQPTIRYATKRTLTSEELGTTKTFGIPISKSVSMPEGYFGTGENQIYIRKETRQPFDVAGTPIRKQPPLIFGVGDIPKGAVKIAGIIGAYSVPYLGTTLFASDVVSGLDKLSKPEEYKVMSPEPKPEGISDAQYEQYLESVDEYNLSVDKLNKGERMTGAIELAGGLAGLGLKLYSKKKEIALKEEIKLKEPSVQTFSANKKVAQRYIQRFEGELSARGRSSADFVHVIKMGNNEYIFFETGAVKGVGETMTGQRELFGFVLKGNKVVDTIAFVSDTSGKETTRLLTRYLTVERSKNSVLRTLEDIGLKKAKISKGTILETIKTGEGRRLGKNIILGSSTSDIRIISQQGGLSRLEGARFIEQKGGIGKIKMFPFEDYTKVSGRGYTAELNILKPTRKVNGQWIYEVEVIKTPILKKIAYGGSSRTAYNVDVGMYEKVEFGFKSFGGGKTTFIPEKMAKVKKVRLTDVEKLLKQPENILGSPEERKSILEIIPKIKSKMTSKVIPTIKPATQTAATLASIAESSASTTDYSAFASAAVPFAKEENIQVPMMKISQQPKMEIKQVTFEVEYTGQPQTLKGGTGVGSGEGYSLKTPQAFTLGTPQVEVPIQAQPQVLDLGQSTTQTVKQPQVTAFKFPTPKIVSQSETKPKVLRSALLKLKTTPAYDVFVRRGGKYSKVAEDLPLGKAMKKGATVTKETLASTFRLIKDKKITYEDDIKYSPEKEIFRTYQIRKGKQIPLAQGPEVFEFIERRKKRLKTGGEFKEIKLARRKKSGIWSL